MGGFGSGRHGGRALADSSLRIDLAWMLRTGCARDGAHMWGSLRWTCGRQHAGSSRYAAKLHEPGEERLELVFARMRQGERNETYQTVWLTNTRPHYGGKQWWMLCPVTGHRVGKLHLPSGGDIFASRKAWRLGYQSQRNAPYDRAFERLFRLQRKLGCEQGFERPIFKPKGMWERTWQSHLAEYRALDAECVMEMAGMMSRLYRFDGPSHKQKSAPAVFVMFQSWHGTRFDNVSATNWPFRCA